MLFVKLSTLMRKYRVIGWIFRLAMRFPPVFLQNKTLYLNDCNPES